mgnify:FL=1
MAAVPPPGQSLGIPGVPNLRDLGGWPARDGVVARGVLFRSAGFGGLSGAGLAAFTRLGIVTVYDLRTAAERAAQPDTPPDGVAGVALDVMGDSASQAPAMLLQVAHDPRAAERVLGGGRAEALFVAGYREIVSLPSARAGYGRLFRELADGRHLPALFHCTTGKDRTGWAAAAALMLLGVSDEDVMTDFLLTNEQLTPFVRPIAARFAAMGGDPRLLDPVLGVRREYLEAAVDEMRSRHGDIEGYFTDGLGLDGTTLGALRRALIEHAEG